MVRRWMLIAPRRFMASAATHSNRPARIVSAAEPAPVPQLPTDGVHMVRSAASLSRDVDITAGLVTKHPTTASKATGTQYSQKQVFVAHNQPAKFKVVGSNTAIDHGGPGSLLSVTMTPGTTVTSQVGSMVCVIHDTPTASISQTNSKLVSNVAIGSHVLKSMLRKLCGGSLFFESVTMAPSSPHHTLDYSESITALFAPKIPSSVAVIPMDGSTRYTVRHKSLLAFAGVSDGDLEITTSVTTVRDGLGMVDGYGVFGYDVSGKGVVAVSGYGDVVRVEVGPDEQCLVNPRYLVAWENSMRMMPADDMVAPAPQIPTRIETPTWMKSWTSSSSTKTDSPSTLTSTKTDSPSLSTPETSSSSSSSMISKTTAMIKSTYSSMADNIQRLASQSFYGAIDTTNTVIRTGTRHLQHWVLGRRGMCRVVGPGTMYLSTRIMPNMLENMQRDIKTSMGIAFQKDGSKSKSDAKNDKPGPEKPADNAKNVSEESVTTSKSSDKSNTKH